MRARESGILHLALWTLLLGAPIPAGGSAPPAPGETDATAALRELHLEPIDAEATTLGALLERGPVLLDFWATWCKPCAAAIPDLVRLHGAYVERGFSVVGISVDGPRNIAKVRPFAARHRIGYPVVIDEDGSLARFFQVTAVPTAFLIDRDGRIVRVVNGYRPGEGKAVDEAVRLLLDAGQK